MSDIYWEYIGDIDEDYRWDIRSRFRWEEVLTAFGIAFRTKPSGKIIMLCLYHEEKTPSLHFWPNGSHHCHGCQTNGDIVTFVFRRLQKDRYAGVYKSELDAFFARLAPRLPTSQLPLPLPDP